MCKVHPVASPELDSEGAGAAAASVGMGADARAEAVAEGTVPADAVPAKAAAPNLAVKAPALASASLSSCKSPYVPAKAYSPVGRLKNTCGYTARNPLTANS